ncbi:hypothetical protein ScPMuIL_005453 [Solemya velum]
MVPYVGCVVFGIAVIWCPQTSAVASELHCTDWGGNEIPQGREFMPEKAEPCNVCLCDRGYATSCRSVSCSPACPDFKRVEGECCKFVCNTPSEGSGDGGFGTNGTAYGDGSGDSRAFENETFANLGLRLVATTVTCFLVLALLLFMVHRIRQKRILIAMRRYEERRRQQQLDSDDQTFFPPSFIGIQCPPYEDLPPPYSPPKPLSPRIKPDEDPPPYEAVQGNNLENNSVTGNFGILSPQNIPESESCPVIENILSTEIAVIEPEVVSENEAADGISDSQSLSTDRGSSEVIFHRNLVKFISNISANSYENGRNGRNDSSSHRTRDSAHFNNKERSWMSKNEQEKYNGNVKKKDRSHSSKDKCERRKSQPNTTSSNSVLALGTDTTTDNKGANFIGNSRKTLSFTTFGREPGNGRIHANRPDTRINVETDQSPDSVTRNKDRYNSLPTKITSPSRISHMTTSGSYSSGHKKSQSCGERGSFSTFIQKVHDQDDTALPPLETNFQRDSSPEQNNFSNDQYSQDSIGIYSENKWSGHEDKECQVPTYTMYPPPSKKSDSILSDLSELSTCSETGEKRLSRTSEALDNDAVYPEFRNMQKKNNLSSSAIEGYFEDAMCKLGNGIDNVHSGWLQRTHPATMVTLKLKPDSVSSQPETSNGDKFPTDGYISGRMINSNTITLGIANVIQEECDSIQEDHDKSPNPAVESVIVDQGKYKNTLIRNGERELKNSNRFSTGSLPQQVHCYPPRPIDSSSSHHYGHVNKSKVNNRSSPKSQNRGKKELDKGEKQTGPYKQYGFIDDPSILVDFWNRANIVGRRDKSKERMVSKKESQNRNENNLFPSDTRENKMNRTTQQLKSVPSQRTDYGSPSGKGSVEINQAVIQRVHRQGAVCVGPAAHDINRRDEILCKQGNKKKRLAKRETNRRSMPESYPHGSASPPSRLMTQSLTDHHVIENGSPIKSLVLNRTQDDSGILLNSSQASSYV